MCVVFGDWFWLGGTCYAAMVWFPVVCHWFGFGFGVLGFEGWWLAGLIWWELVCVIWCSGWVCAPGA